MTRVALFSDLHGNTPALRAFLATPEVRSADEILNLGDIASGGVDPRGTLDLLGDRPRIRTVRGNHERQLLGRTEHVPGGADWIAAQVLLPRDRDWLASLPSRLEPFPRVLAFHGTPDDDLTYLLETVDPSIPRTAIREATDEEVVERLGAWLTQADVFLCGHTHLQRTRRLPGGQLVVNPGSLGWPAYADDHVAPHVVETGTPQARFAVLENADPSRPGDWTVTQHSIDYDVDEAIRWAVDHGRADVAVALATGRMGELSRDA